MSFNAIKIFDLPKRDFKEGSIADIAVLDIDNRHTYSYSEIKSKSKNSPFIGRSLYGFNQLTMVNGIIVYNNLGDNNE